ncbi:MAG: hypothetical protein MZV63_14770 [Marinilabiliales bacterium]|nr:hypothetical protein [Marinilabiliales bacterium]
MALANKILDLALAKNLQTLRNLKLFLWTEAKLVKRLLNMLVSSVKSLSFHIMKKSKLLMYRLIFIPETSLPHLLVLQKQVLDVQVYKDIAMQIAAMNPVAVDKDDVPEKVIAQEIEIGKEQAQTRRQT